MNLLTSDTHHFVLPHVRLGDTVLWRNTRDDTTDAAAIVTKVGGGGALGLMILAPDAQRPIPVDGVLHIDDPRNAARQSESGMWRHTERTNSLADLLNEISDAIASIEERLAEVIEADKSI